MSSPGAPPPADSSKKIAAGVCAILFGWLGVHKFILGYTKAGIITLIVSLFTCGSVTSIIGLIEEHHLPDQERRRFLSDLRRQQERMVLSGSPGTFSLRPFGRGAARDRVARTNLSVTRSDWRPRGSVEFQ